tara:strand:+ start:273 stop:377 length:105 start_codon:yes stop_codon:yes gene_type:complete
MNKILSKIKKWWRKHIADVVPSHLDDLFDNKKSN